MNNTYSTRPNIASRKMSDEFGLFDLYVLKHSYEKIYGNLDNSIKYKVAVFLHT